MLHLAFYFLTNLRAWAAIFERYTCFSRTRHLVLFRARPLYQNVRVDPGCMLFLITEWKTSVKQTPEHGFGRVLSYSRFPSVF